MVGTEALVVLSLCGFLLLVIAISSWYRRKRTSEKDHNNISSLSRIHETIIDGQRTFRIATVSRQSGGALTLDVYEVRLPRPNDPSGLPSIRLLAPPLPPRNSRSPENPFIHNASQSQSPPAFNVAVNMPSPNNTNANTTSEGISEELSLSDISPPPPRYQDVIPTQTPTLNLSVPDCKISTDNCIVTVDPTTSTIIDPQIGVGSVA